MILGSASTGPKAIDMHFCLVYCVRVAMGALETSKPHCVSWPPRLELLIMSASLTANCFWQNVGCHAGILL